MRQCNNLSGVLRDLRYLFEHEGVLTDEETRLYDEASDLLSYYASGELQRSRPDVDGADDDADDAADDDSSDLEGDECADGEDDDAEPGGHDARSASIRTPSRRVDGVVASVPGRIGGEAESGLPCVRRSPLGAPERLTAPAVTRSDPRPARAPSRKGVSRGKKRSKK